MTDNPQAYGADFMIRHGVWIVLINRDVEYDKSSSKLSHTIINEKTGSRDYADWSPYDPMTYADLCRFIDLECPKRHGPSPWDSASLELLWWQTYGPMFVRSTGAVFDRLGLHDRSSLKSKAAPS